MMSGGSEGAFNLLLIQLPLAINERHKRVMPLSLLYIAAYLRQQIPGLEAEILDAQAENLDYNEICDRVWQKRRDVIGITFWTAQATFAYTLSPALKRLCPTAKIVFGGVHPTIFPDEASKHADYVIVREGERPFCELIRRLMAREELDGIPGLGYRPTPDEDFRSWPDDGFIQNLDELPFPAWDMLKLDCYTTQMHVKGGRRVPVIGSRGCPYNCVYCTSPFLWQRSVRYRAPVKVVDEIEAIGKKLGIHQIHFWDDNLFMVRDYIKPLCEEIIRRGLKINWVGLTRASHLVKNADLMQLAKDSGCIGMEIGIESANPETFDVIDKQESLEDIITCARIQAQVGMYPMFTYMAFNPGETLAGYYLQAEFIDKIHEGLPWAEHFHPLAYPVYIGQFCTAHPGTKLYSMAPHLGIVLAKDWADYYHHKINFVPNSLLDDVPIRNIDELGPVDYWICVNAMDGTNYEFHHEHQTTMERRIKHARYLKFVKAFFASCNGRLTLRQMWRELTAYQRLDADESLRYLAFTSLMLGQRGLIRSAIFQKDLQIRPKSVNVPIGRKRLLVFELFRRIGGVFDVLDS
ncbi:MAG: B12-binding domain-containing radical SAM protein [Candidatus Coatesbacteria bacterium]|nr:B12-binding domain-containing radical SAM protein [Candidatus Coatesbacteria bacterium]